MTGKQLKNSILQWAIQGKLVPQDPNEEPASVLLEKIRAEKARLVKEGKIKKDKKESIIYRGDDNSYYEKFADGTTVCIDDEIPFEIPASWRWERWGNLSHSIQYGYNAPAEKTGDIRMVRISDIQNGEVLWATVPYCHISQKEIDTYLLQKDDILFARTGGTVGKSFLVKEVPYPSIYAGYLIRTRYSHYLSSQYMKYFMESQLYWEQLRNGTIATAQPNCNGQTLAKMILPIPPFNEQVRITEKLNLVLERVEKYGTSQDKLDSLNANINELLKKSILQEAIQGKLVPQEPNDEPASALLQRIKDEKLRLVKEGKLKKKEVIDSTIVKGDDNKYYEQISDEVVDITEDIPFEIPDSWEWTRLKHICTKLVDGDHNPPVGISNKTDFLMLSSRNINNNTLVDLDKVRYLTQDVFNKENERTNAEKGDILFTSVGTLGRSCIFDGSHNVCFQRSVSVLRTMIFNRYLKYFLDNPHTQDYIFSHATGTAQKGFYLNQLADVLVSIPPYCEQQRIVNKIEMIFNEIKG